MQKIISLLLIAFMMLGVGCSGSASNPETTVKTFIEAGKAFDFVQMAGMVNPDETAAKAEIGDLMSGDEESPTYDEMQKYFLDYFRNNATKIQYNIVSSAVEEDKAKVTVDFQYVNGAPLLKGTIAEVFSKLFSLAFTGIELSDEEMGQYFVDALKSQQSQISETMKESTVEINLSNIDNTWYVSEPSSDLYNVFTSNFYSVADEINQIFGGDASDEEQDVEEQIVVNKGIGDEVVLATINLKINSVEEKQSITPEYGPVENAKDGAKFVVVNAEIVNTTKQTISMSPDLLLIDDQDREYEATDAFLLLNDALDYRDLSPGIKEKGSWLYQIPIDSESYSLAIGKAGTNEIYMIKLK